MTEQLSFGHDGSAGLDGTWSFYQGDHELADLGTLRAEDIVVPALWEAQGHLELDGYAWYARTFTLGDVDGHYTLHFGAVMDTADVYVNGTHVGSHVGPFTPFSFDVTPVLRSGTNEIAVRVFDPPVDHPEHIRSAHGKQGWANWVFPSRPSLYMTYGGIWQPVTLQRHGPVVVDDVFINSDPNDLMVSVEVRNVSDEQVAGRLSIRTLGMLSEHSLALAPGASTVVEAKLGVTPAPRWSPTAPVLHDLLADVVVDGEPSHSKQMRFGLRTIEINGTRLLLNGVPYRMKSALVQGFRADGLYDEGSREEIEAEVRAAHAMGFNTLRLHIKAFDPRYLDICDELGMLLHCDIPVAEPIAHEEMGTDTLLARRSIAAAEEQVKRDRNHPSIIMWSAMNELCFDRQEARQWDEYEQFARAVAGAVIALDPTRPVIENDWAEPDPDRVFVSPILTAHWYGRLHADYLEKIERSSAQSQDLGKPFYVTEFGDWGLPDMPKLEDPPFWDTQEIYALGLAETCWPDTLERFVRETQRYQGLSDRMQIEVFRRYDHIGGYCLTELTDVPHELNGLLDLHRDPKPLAIRELARANQVVLPMLKLDSLVVTAGELLRASVWISNDGPALEGLTLRVRFGDAGLPIDHDHLSTVDTSSLPLSAILARFDESSWAVRIDEVAAFGVTEIGEALIVAPDVPGAHDLIVRLRTPEGLIAENRYPIHVVAETPPLGAVRTDEGTGSVLAGLGATDGDGPLIVGEGALDDRSGKILEEHLRSGGVALVLAQPATSADSYPVPFSMRDVQTEWGSSVFHFTTDSGALSSLPRRNLLVAEDSTIQAVTAVTGVEDRPFPDDPFVIAYKPSPGAMTGSVVGEHRVGEGRLIFCQYRLLAPAAKGDAAARALLYDLVSHARSPYPRLTRRTVAKEDGRSMWLYREDGQ